MIDEEKTLNEKNNVIEILEKNLSVVESKIYEAKQSVDNILNTIKDYEIQVRAMQAEIENWRNK